MMVLTPRHDSPEQQQQHHTDEPHDYRHHNSAAQDPSSSAISRTPSGVSAWKQVAGGEAVETSRSGNNKRLNQFRAQRSNSRGDDGHSSRSAPNTQKQKGGPPSEPAYFYQRPSSMDPVPLHDAHPPPPSSSIYAGRRSPSAQHTETRRSMSSGGGYAAPKHVSMMYDRLASGSVGNHQQQH